MESIQWQPEFAIGDFRLRAGETGIAVLDWLRDHFDASLPGIIITGDTAADRLQEVTSSGYRVLHKPVSPAKLRALLRNIPG
jgi:CheY-like chemotaxis protein